MLIYEQPWLKYTRFPFSRVVVSNIMTGNQSRSNPAKMTPNNVNHMMKYALLAPFLSDFLEDSSLLNLCLALHIPTDLKKFRESHVQLAGVWVPKRSSGAPDAQQLMKASETFVLTPHSYHNLRQIASALALNSRLGSGSRPIIVEGAAGCGKTSIIRYVTSLLGYGHDLVELHLDDASDGKALLGSYVCTDVPGEFKWQPGSITIAALSGRWVLIEDVDRASFDVLASLRSLMEARMVTIPGQPRALPVHPDFQLFATRTIVPSSSGIVKYQAFSGPFASFSDLWIRISLASSTSAIPTTVIEPETNDDTPTNDKSIVSEFEELHLLLTALYPNFPPILSDGLLLCYGLVTAAMTVDISEPSKPQTAFEAGIKLYNSLPENISSLLRSLDRFGRNLSKRDFLRWAKRISSLHSVRNRLLSAQQSQTNVSQNRNFFITDQERMMIVHEGATVLAGHIADKDVRRAATRALAFAWGCTSDMADNHIDIFKPEVKYALDKSGAKSDGSGHPQPVLSVGGIALTVPTAIYSTAVSNGKLQNPLPIGFSPTRHSLCLLERLAACVSMNEPVLLVGGTGNGKTSVIQALASSTGANILVYNLNIQSDSSDLLGGFKPVHLKQIAIPLLSRFEELFSRTFDNAESATNAQNFLSAIRTAAFDENWPRLIGGFMRALQRAQDTLAKPQSTLSPERVVQTLVDWEKFGGEVKFFERQYATFSKSKSSEPNSSNAGAFAFTFIEGILIQALRTGAWILLDEINLASPETLQRLAGLLEGGSITLTERGDTEPIPRHPNFRLFAAMNPSTDFGKRDLPPALRSRFAEHWVDEVENPEDLATVVTQYVSQWPEGRGNNDPTGLVQNIVKFYLAVRALSAPITGVLRDGAMSRPHYSLRSLTRALRSASELIIAGFDVKRALHEGIAMSFLTQLEDGSAAKVLAVLHEHLGKSGPATEGMGITAAEKVAAAASETAADKKKKKKKDSQAAMAASVIQRLTGQAPPAPGSAASFSDSSAPKPKNAENAIEVMGFWIPQGPLPPNDLTVPQGDTGVAKYVLVPSVQRHVRSLARAALCGRSPVLLQGPTSAGKTSMVEYLAHLTGHVCVRINNHEHTDISEYIGAYATDESGKMSFSEGLLVQALRKGHWLILDELNLAPSEVLEALNRLLDDNRELFIPETQEIVRPHPHFMLFATQNPAGTYGGRKTLSLAFRNRFVELHVDDIPSPELVTILTLRSRLPSSFAERMVAVMEELQRIRQSSDVFSGKHGFITPRDLLRWAGRKPFTYQALAEEGYLLLAERLRDNTEKALVKSVLESQCKVVISPRAIFDEPFTGAIELEESPVDSEKLTEEEAQVIGAKRAAGELFPRQESDRSTKRKANIAQQPWESNTPESPFVKLIRTRLQAFLRLLSGGTDDDIASSTVSDSDSLPLEKLRPGTINGTEGLGSITITKELRRLFTIVGRCIEADEPVLLVGETGCGKTTIVQLFALLLQQNLSIVNCHAHTETADFLGSQRPVRNKLKHHADAIAHAEKFLSFVTENLAAMLSDAWTENSGLLLDSCTVLSENHQLFSFVKSSSSEFLVQTLLAWRQKLDTISAKVADFLALPDAVPSEEVKMTDVEEQVPGNGLQLKKESFESLRQTIDTAMPVLLNAINHARNASALFEWVDGPLVNSMREGGFFLLDEASLAEDAVLERLNSVLEPSRTLTLAEKGDAQNSAQKDDATSIGDAIVVKAKTTFRFFATMNPGGDFGKRELSPALRNRFTEVWVPALSDLDDIRLIIASKAAEVAIRHSLLDENILLKTRSPKLSYLYVQHPLQMFIKPMMDFIAWFDAHASTGRILPPETTPQGGTTVPSNRPKLPKVFQLTLRDLHTWLQFMGIMVSTSQNYTRNKEKHQILDMAPFVLDPWEAYAHGACLALLDGLGLGQGLSEESCYLIRQASAEFIVNQVPEPMKERIWNIVAPRSKSIALKSLETKVEVPEGLFGMPPFLIEASSDPEKTRSPSLYAMTAPTTLSNLLRVLRAMQLKKPILLEGSPGVGKTSLVEALARAAGHKLVRINLSDQTDMADLFGQDLPDADAQNQDNDKEVPRDASKSGASSGFRWCDGILLQAIKNGSWVLLDELNLASQPVLEGLNAVLDHRGTVFIPELGKSFACPPEFRLFATQNPVGQGGGRKGLPKSFLNRFAKVYAEALSSDDQLFVASTLFPQLNTLPHKIDSDPSKPVHPQDTLLARMIAFNISLHADTMGEFLGDSDDPRKPMEEDSTALKKFDKEEKILSSKTPLYGASGKPWEFNLRDLFRWCEMILQEQPHGKWNPGAVLDGAYLQRLRSPTDRAAAIARFVQIFARGEAGVGVSGSDPDDIAHVTVHDIVSLRKTDDWIALNNVVLPRAPLTGVWEAASKNQDTLHPDQLTNALRSLRAAISAPISAARVLAEQYAFVFPENRRRQGRNLDDETRESLLSPSLLRTMYHIAAAVQRSWPILLIGSKSSGKTTSIRELAKLLRVRLRDICLAPSTDATELIGCFEQANSARIIRSIADTIIGLVLGFIQSVNSIVNSTFLLSEDQRKQTVAFCDEMRKVTVQYEWNQQDNHDTVDPLFDEIISLLKKDGVTFLQSVASAADSSLNINEVINAFAASVSSVSVQAATLKEKLLSGTSTRGAFEWVDGALVEAMEKGEWVVLDSVNVASASVIDRLNAVLETNGTLLVNECGLDNNGKPRIIKPHPSFRIFFTMDPSLGDVSRALRNRCTEISIPDLSLSQNDLRAERDNCTGITEKIFGLVPGALSKPITCIQSESLRKVIAYADSFANRIFATFTPAPVDWLTVLYLGGIRSVSLAQRLLELQVESIQSCISQIGKISGYEVPRPRQLRLLAEMCTASVMKHMQERATFTNTTDSSGTSSGSNMLSEVLGEVVSLIYASKGVTSEKATAFVDALSNIDSLPYAFESLFSGASVPFGKGLPAADMASLWLFNLLTAPFFLESKRTMDLVSKNASEWEFTTTFLQPWLLMSIQGYLLTSAGDGSDFSTRSSFVLYVLDQVNELVTSAGESPSNMDDSDVTTNTIRQEWTPLYTLLKEYVQSFVDSATQLPVARMFMERAQQAHASGLFARTLISLSPLSPSDLTPSTWDTLRAQLSHPHNTSETALEGIFLARDCLIASLSIVTETTAFWMNVKTSLLQFNPASLSQFALATILAVRSGHGIPSLHQHKQLQNALREATTTVAVPARQLERALLSQAYIQLPITIDIIINLLVSALQNVPLSQQTVIESEQTLHTLQKIFYSLATLIRFLSDIPPVVALATNSQSAHGEPFLSLEERHHYHSRVQLMWQEVIKALKSDWKSLTVTLDETSQRHLLLSVRITNRALNKREIDTNKELEVSCGNQAADPLSAALSIPRDVLWKYGGHPIIPRCRNTAVSLSKLQSQIWKLVQEVVFAPTSDESREFKESSAKFGKLGEYISSFQSLTMRRMDIVNAKLKYQLIGIMGALVNAGKRQKIAPSAEDPSNPDDATSDVYTLSVARALEALMNHLSERIPANPLKLAAEAAAATAMSEGDILSAPASSLLNDDSYEVPPSLGIEAEVLERLSLTPTSGAYLRKSVRLGQNSLVVDAASRWALIEERTTHAFIAQTLGAALAEKKKPALYSRPVFDQITRILQVAVTGTRWTPLEILPLQSLQWAIQANADVDIVLAILPSLLASWHARANQFLHSLHPLAKDAASIHSDVTEIIAKMPCAMFEYERRVYLVQLLAGHSMTNVKQPLSPLENVKNTLQRISEEFSLAAFATFHVLSVFSNTVSFEVKQEYVEHITQWYTSIVKGSTGSDSLPRILDISHKSADERWAQLSFTALGPALQSVAVASEHLIQATMSIASMSSIHVDEHALQEAQRLLVQCSFFVGTATVRTSLLKLALLAPMSSIDPAEEPTLRKENLLLILKQMRGQIQFRELSNALSGLIQVYKDKNTSQIVPNKRSVLNFLQSSLQQLIAECDELEEQRVYRLKYEYSPQNPGSEDDGGSEGSANSDLLSSYSTTFNDLYQETSTFLHSIGQNTRVDGLLSKALDSFVKGKGNVDVSPQVNAWCDAAIGFANRLRGAFETFADVANGIEESIRSIVSGFVMLMAAVDESEELAEEQKAGKTVVKSDAKELLAIQVKIDNELFARTPLTNTTIVEAKRKERLWNSDVPVKMDDLLASSLSILQATKEEDDKEASNALNLVGETEEEAKERAFRELIPDFFAEHFAKLLPKKHTLDAQDQNKAPMAYQDPEHANSTKEASSFLKRKIVQYPCSLYELAVTYLYLYNPDDIIHHGLLLPIKEKQVSAGSTNPEELSRLQLLADGSSVGTVEPHLLHQLHKLTAAPMIGSSGSNTIDTTDSTIAPYNFYKDPNVGLATLAIKPLVAFAKRVLELLTTFPGNEILVLLLRICDQAMKLSIEAPLGSLLSGCELLVTRAQDWERNAPRMHKLDDALTGVAQVITRWRRLELASWVALLRGAERDAARDAAELFIQLRAVVMELPKDCAPNSRFALSSEERRAIANTTKWLMAATGCTDSATSAVWALPGAPRTRFELPPESDAEREAKKYRVETEEQREQRLAEEKAKRDAGETYLRSVFDSCDRFIRASPLGQYSTRIALLRALAKELHVVVHSLHPEKRHTCPFRLALLRPASHTIRGIAEYYDQYTPAVENSLLASKAPLLQEVFDQVKLHRWDEQSYYAAQESAQKSHQIVYKAFSNYKEVLNLPCSSSIEGYKPDAPNKDGNTALARSSKKLSKKVQKFTKDGKSLRIGNKFAQKEIELSDDGCIMNSKQLQSCLQNNVLESAEDPISFTSLSEYGNDFSVLSTLPNVSKRMVTLLTKAGTGILGAKAVSRRCDHVYAIETHSSLIFDTVTDLASPTIGKMIKKRALTEALRRLAQSGLSPLSAATKPQISDLFSLFSVPGNVCMKTLSSLLDFHSWTNETQTSALSLLQRSHSYYQRAMDQTLRLRLLIVGDQVSKDITPLEAKRGVGFVEHLLFLTTQQRALLTGLSVHQEALVHASNLLHASKYVLNENGNTSNVGSSLYRNHPVIMTVERLLSSLQVTLTRINACKLLLRSQARTMTLAPDAELSVLDNALDESLFLGVYDYTAAEGQGANEKQQSVAVLNKIPPILVSRMKVVNMVCDRLTHLIGILESKKTEIVASYPSEALAHSMSNTASVSKPVSELWSSREDLVNLDNVNVYFARSERVDGTIASIKEVTRTTEVEITEMLNLVESSISTGGMILVPFMTSALKESLQLVQESNQYMLSESSHNASMSIDYSTFDSSSLTTLFSSAKELLTTVQLSVQALIASNTSTGEKLKFDQELMNNLFPKASGGIPNTGLWGLSFMDDILIAQAEEEWLQRQKSREDSKAAEGESKKASEFGSSSVAKTDSEDVLDALEEQYESATHIHLLHTHTQVCHTFHTANVPSIIEKALALISNLYEVLSTASNTSTELPSSVHFVIHHCANLLRNVATCHSALVMDFLFFQKACAKLFLVLSACHLRILKEGFCIPEEGDGDGEGQGEGGSNSDPTAKFDTGVGIGEGEGQKDVSDQIEHEGQVEGLQNDEPHEKNDENGEGSEEGVEMTNDFEGDMKDMPKGEDDHEDLSDDGEQEEIDREMGKADGPDSQIVDEKLWDGEDDSEDGKKPEQADSSVSGDTDDNNMRAKEENEESNSKDEKQQPQKEKQKPEKADTETMEEDGSDGEEVEEKAEDAESGDKEDNASGAEEEDEQSNLDIEVDGDLGHDSDEDAAQDEGGEVPQPEEGPAKVDASPDEAAAEDEQAMDLDENADDETGPSEPEEGNEDGKEADVGEEPEMQLDEDMNLDGGIDESVDAADEEIPEDAPTEETAEPDDEEAGAEEEPESKEEPEDHSAPMQGEPDELKEGEEAAEEEKKDVPKSKSQKKKQQKPLPGAVAEDGDDTVQGSESAAEKKQESGDAKDSDSEEEHQEGDEGDEELAVPENAMEEDGDSDEQNQASSNAQDNAEGEESEKQGAWQRNMEPNSKGDDSKKNRNNISEGISAKEDLNPLMNPEKALRHWNAKIRPEKNTSKSEESGKDEEDNLPEDLVNAETDVIATESGGVSMLAPKARNPEDDSAEDGDESDGKDDEDLPARFPEEEEDVDAEDDNASVESGPKADGADDGDGDQGEITDVEDEEPLNADLSEKEHKRKPKPSATDMMDPALKSAEPDEMDSDEVPIEEENHFQHYSNKIQGNVFDDDLSAAMSHSQYISNSQRNAQNSLRDGQEEVSYEQLRDSYETLLHNWTSKQGVSDVGATASSLWSALSAMTSESASRLCEGLRLVLEPTLASKLGGEYRSGKRINMRKVIPYIASNFRKDKIWQRRSKPSKRTYQILLAVDDSSSMSPKNRGGGQVAWEAMALISQALSKLEIGEMGVLSFGSNVQILHPLDAPFTNDAGARILSSFTFSQKSTRTELLLNTVTKMMGVARQNAVARSSGVGGTKCMQIVFVISDGIIGGHAERESIRQWCIEAMSQGLLIVLVIIDKGSSTESSDNVSVLPSTKPSENKTSCSLQESITTTRTVRFVNGRVVTQPYLDDYPFPYYILIKNTRTLPEVLSDSLRQWMEMFGNMD